jgi:hypothetical protein
VSGVLYIVETAVEATTGHMPVTFKSGGDNFRFHLPAHVALRFRQAVRRDAWRVCCPPDADVVALKAEGAKRRLKRKPASES